jgi:hypothetical protein
MRDGHPARVRHDDTAELTAQHPAARFCGRVYSGAPQRGFARARLTHHGQRGWFRSDDSTSDEPTYPPPLGGADKLATHRGHTFTHHT